MSDIKTILFDVGGVLSHDGHETYLTHAIYGLCRNLNLPKEQIFNKTAPVFKKYAVLPSAKEADFWREISAALCAPLSDPSIITVKQKIQDINSEVVATFKLLQSRGISIGIISNSTSFFYPTVARKLRLVNFVKPNLYFLSHVEKCLKSGGLFEVAATRLDPSHTFIIDDRSKNVAYAQKLGFRSSLYSMESGKSLLDEVNKISNNPHQKGA